MVQLKHLELEVAPRFQRSEWRVQRIGWAMWALVVLAALVGVLGPGPLSNAESSSPDGSLTVEYDRFLHNNNPTKLEVSVHSSAADGEPLRINVSRRLLDAIRILRIEPEPGGRELTGNGVTYTFPRGAALEHTKVLFHIEYEQFGSQGGQIALDGHDPITLTQFVYP